MNKKGGHVDWAISIGIFLVYLIGMFILLRPGVTPVYKPDSLLKIIEDKINTDVMWEVREIPIILTQKCGAWGDECNNGQLVEHPMITINVEGNWSLSSTIEPDDKAKWENGALTDLENAEIPAGTYLMKLSPESGEIEEPKVSISDAKPCQCLKDKEGNVHTSLGASTFKEGVNQNYLDSFIQKFKKDKEIKDIKNEFGFPREKSFQIIINTDTKLGEEPYAQANVFAKQIKTWYLDEEGNLNSPIEIIISVW